MATELNTLIKQLKNRSYGDNTIPDVIGYLECLENKLKLVSDLNSLKDVQGEKGCWDSDDYMRGLFNGLELASSTLEQREPKYKPAFDEKDHLIDVLSRCLFQMQEAAKELIKHKENDCRLDAYGYELDRYKAFKRNKQ